MPPLASVTANNGSTDNNNQFLRAKKRLKAGIWNCRFGIANATSATGDLRRRGRIAAGRMGQALNVPLVAPLTTSSGQVRRASSAPRSGRSAGRPRGSGTGTQGYIPTGRARGRPVGSRSQPHGFSPGE